MSFTDIAELNLTVYRASAVEIRQSFSAYEMSDFQHFNAKLRQVQQCYLLKSELIRVFWFKLFEKQFDITSKPLAFQSSIAAKSEPMANQNAYQTAAKAVENWYKKWWHLLVVSLIIGVLIGYFEPEISMVLSKYCANKENTSNNPMQHDEPNATVPLGTA